MARERPDPHEKLVIWVGSSKRDLLRLPIPVVDAIGSAISYAQFGGKHPSIKPWRGAGSGVFEIVQDHYGDTYRAVYSVGFAAVVCRKRVRTSRTGMAIARSRKQRVEVSSGNVFADLGFPKAEERETKVRLAVAIQRSITALGLTQAAAARVLGTSQPKVSALVSARLEGFSVERLMNFLVALGNDVEIIVRKRRSTRSPGRIHVAEV